jgi:D-alanine-D-alanine ligase
MGRLRVVVLTGGTSAERAICLKSGGRVMAALDPERYEARALDLAAITSGRAGELARALMAPEGEEPKQLSPSAAARGNSREKQATSAALSRQGRGLVQPDDAEQDARPDVVFIALHGGTGENGTVQGMLELLGIPYTGSGVLASALAMDKIMSKKIFERERIPTPKWMPLKAAQRGSAEKAVMDSVGLPCVVKPACEGSTIGVTVVRRREDLAPALDAAFQHGPQALAEEFIEGTEITGPVLGNEDARALPLVEIVPAGGFYDYDAKYTPGATEEIVPARIPASEAERARELTLAAHHALGCRGFSRVDMIVSRGEVYVLEVNSIPGLTDTSLVPRAAEADGISFSQLAERIIELALEEHGPGSGNPEP